MARPPLPIGTAGNIKVTGVGKAQTARCRYRDVDGITRTLERSGETKGEAKRNVQKAIRDRQARAGTGELSSESTVAELMNKWWPWKIATSTLSAGTQANYTDIIQRIVVPGIGQLRLREATTGRIDDWLIKERRARKSQAELARTLLNQGFTFATQRGYVAGNPVSSVSKPKKVTVPPRALSTVELSSLRDAVRGMRQNTWLGDIFEVQLGVAGRIGEVLALTVDDLDLDNPGGPRVRVAATVIVPTGQRPQVQPHTKDGPDGRRTVIIHDWVADVLRNRALLAGPSGRLYESRNQTLLDPHNVRESWRNIREAAGLGWVKPHHLRKTALTRINDVFGLEVASKFADHKGTAVTERHYIEKLETAGPDVRAAFDELAPRGQLRLVENA